MNKIALPTTDMAYPQTCLYVDGPTGIAIVVEWATSYVLAALQLTSYTKGMQGFNVCGQSLTLSEPQRQRAQVHTRACRGLVSCQ